MLPTYQNERPRAARLCRKPEKGSTYDSVPLVARCSIPTRSKTIPALCLSAQPDEVSDIGKSRCRQISDEIASLVGSLDNTITEVGGSCQPLQNNQRRYSACCSVCPPWESLRQVVPSMIRTLKLTRNRIFRATGFAYCSVGVNRRYRIHRRLFDWMCSDWHEGYPNALPTRSVLRLTAREVQTIFDSEGQLWTESSLILRDSDQPYLMVPVSYECGSAIIRKRLR